MQTSQMLTTKQVWNSCSSCDRWKSTDLILDQQICRVLQGDLFLKKSVQKEVDLGEVSPTKSHQMCKQNFAEVTAIFKWLNSINQYTLTDYSANLRSFSQILYYFWEKNIHLQYDSPLVVMKFFWVMLWHQGSVAFCCAFCSPKRSLIHGFCEKNELSSSWKTNTCCDEPTNYYMMAMFVGVQPSNFPTICCWSHIICSLSPAKTLQDCGTRRLIKGPYTKT